MEKKKVHDHSSDHTHDDHDHHDHDGHNHSNMEGSRWKMFLPSIISLSLLLIALYFLSDTAVISNQDIQQDAGSLHPL